MDCNCASSKFGKRMFKCEINVLFLTIICLWDMPCCEILQTNLPKNLSTDKDSSLHDNSEEYIQL